MDRHLSLENHVNEMVNKADKIVSFIEHNFKDLNVKTLIVLLYQSIV
jgi:hypothetical protein